MDSLMQDVRFAVRTLAKSPLFTILCVLCLAVGIGVNVNIYSAVYAAFMRPFGFTDPERLVILEDRDAQRGARALVFSFESFQDLQQTAGMERLAASAYRSITITDGTEPVRLEGNAVSWSLFPMLGVQPHIGRGFQPSDDAPGAAPTVVLGYGVWSERYHADSSIVGRTLPVNGVPATVVGVMPAGFKFPDQQDAWIPVTPLLDGTPRDQRELLVMGRLKAGVDFAAANAALQATSARIAERYPDVQGEWRAVAQPLREFLVPQDTRLAILSMMGAVTFVLLIACANVANLMLARATSRGREIAVRTALGAGRGRIVRQLLTESVMLALIACPAGILIAYWLLDVVLASIPPNDMPYYIKFAIDTPVLIYAVAIAALTGIVFGLAPAVQAARSDLQGALKEGGRGSGTGAQRHRLRNALVIGEVALSMVLLVGASLFVRSFLNVQQQTGGIDTANMLTMRFYLPGDRYASPTALAARVRDVVERVSAVPGVKSVTASNQIPLSGGGSGGRIEIDGQPVEARNAPLADWTGATAHWFTTLGIPMVSGRDFTEQEARDSSRVAVINETMARRFWPQESAIGRRFRLVGDTAKGWFTVIGVSRDYRNEEIGDNDPLLPAFVVSYAYLPTRNTGLMIKAERSPAELTAGVRQAIRASDPAMPVFDVMTMEELRRFGFWSIRLFGWMFSMFGVVALLLAAVGVYGVIAYGVSQRTREIGVRVALGAQPSDVIRLVVVSGAVVAFIGIAIGLAASLGITRVIQSLLVGVDATDPLSFLGVTLFLSAIALLASYVPARRATRVDPLTALRAE